MISHSNSNFLMDWEPTENYDMDVDVTQGPFSFEDCDIYMASPSQHSPPSFQDIHMASPSLTPQLPSISEIALFLPPLEMKTKPTVFSPFNSHAVSCQALEPLAYPRAVPSDDSPFVYIPAVSNYLPEPPTVFSASCQGDNYTSSVHNHINFAPNSVYRPVTPSPSKSRTTFRDVSPQSDISDEESERSEEHTSELQSLV